MTEEKPQQTETGETKDRNQTTEEAKSGRGVSRRAVCAGVVGVAAVAAVAGIAYKNSQGSGSSDDSSSSKTELTDVQKKIHEEIIATYNVENQAKVREELDAEYAKKAHGESDPFVKVDPFGTNTLSAYVRFTTEDAVRVSYTVRGSKGAGYADFTRTPVGGDVAATEHEFSVIGLIPGKVNTVNLTLTAEDGSERTVKIEPAVSSLKGEEDASLSRTSGESDAELADGLFVILGADSDKLDFMYYYDNDGYIRGEVPLRGYRAHRLLFDDEGMYYSISTTKIARVNNLGQVTGVYDTGSYELHHDYVFDGDGNILVLASDLGAEADLDIDRKGDKNKEKRNNVEDKVIKVDVATGEVSLVVDLGEVFPDLKAKAKIASDGDLDWIHINTIQWLGNDTVILSSRETSTVIKLTDVFGTPTVDWLMGDESFWKGSGFEDKLLSKVGIFASAGGQHSVTYLPDASLGEGCYQLLMFDNNFGSAESYPKFDWSQLGSAVVTEYGKGTHSFARLLTVDENARTYTLDEQFAVPFSAYVSSAQKVGYTGNTLVDSGQAKVFSEYDAYGLKIAKYEFAAEKFIYRVYKYDFDGFYFA